MKIGRRDDPPDEPTDDDPPDELTGDDPEESLRQLLRESAPSDSVIPRAKHKRYAKRAMRRRKASAHISDVQSGRRDDTPLTPVRTHMTSKVQAIPPAPQDALAARKVKERGVEVERLRAERRRLQELVHKLRKDAADAKRELRFIKAELDALSEREQVLSRENQRLQLAILRSNPSFDPARERRFSGVAARKASADDDQTGTK